VKESKIEWTDHTFNPWIGCTKVSAGCANCYAETLMDTRYGRVRWGKGNPRSRTSESYWRQPMSWQRNAANLTAPQRVFCASLADVFDNEAPAEWLHELFWLITQTHSLRWLLLTKRPENIIRRIKEVSVRRSSKVPTWDLWADWESAYGLPNVWLGVSAEDQQRYDERVGELMTIPARIRFVSAEPLLGPIVMGPPSPHWIIVGGESGPGARPMDADWVRALRDESQQRHVAFFFKQWGGVDKHATGRWLDDRLHNALPAEQKLNP
jgi:protein gp37